MVDTDSTVDAVFSIISGDVPVVSVILPLVISAVDGAVSLVSPAVAVIINEADVLVGAVASVSIVSDTSVFVVGVTEAVEDSLTAAEVDPVDISAV